MTTAAGAATVGLLSSDIEGSTRLLQQLGPAYSEVLLAHRALLRAAFEAHGGDEQSTEGDAFFVTFPTASDAVAAALAAQKSLAKQTWPAGADVQVRMGVHVGEIQTVAGTIMGMAVHETARIAAVAHGGQVLVSAAAVGLAGDLPCGATWLDLGSHRLKDIGAPVQLFQLAHIDLPAAFPPVRSQGASRNNLPAQASAFIGRDREVAEIDELVGNSRLVTITGAGGAGKTRVALRLAAEQGERFPDGVWFVNLAPISDPGAVVQSIVAAMGLPDAAAEDLGGALGQRHVLLLVDNCEHVISAVVDVVDDLLRGCPGVSVLATSREPLGLQGEVAWRLPSLDETDAIELFCTRARAVNSRFTLTEANREAVGEVCRRLDAIPLALELAAARLGSLTVEQLAPMIDQRFRLLAGGGRGAMARQRTLLATVDWSYDLLDVAEQITIRRLGVFIGGFTLEAAEAVCATEEIDAVEVFDLIDRLVAKSLVLAEERDGAVRYRLLETIRHYALDRLIQTGEMDAVRDAHLSWAQQLALTAEAPTWFGGGEEEWLPRLDDEAANLRAAFDWALERARTDIATSILLALQVWFMARGRSREGAEWCELLRAAGGSAEDRALRAFGEFNLAIQHGGIDAESLARLRREMASLPDSSHPWLAPGADGCLAVASIAAGDPDSAMQAVEACQAAVVAARPMNEFVLSMTLDALAIAHRSAGNLDGARAAAEEALALTSAAGFSVGRSRCTSRLAQIALQAGDRDSAWRYAEEAVDIARRTGDSVMLISGTQQLATLAGLRDDINGALDLLVTLIDVARDSATDSQLMWIHNVIAWYALLGGDAKTADVHARRALEMAAGSNIHAEVLHTAGEAARTSGELRRAWDILLESGRLCRSGGPLYRKIFLTVLEGLAGVRNQSGDPEGAALLLGAAGAPPEDGLRMPAETRRVAQTVQALHDSLGEQRFSAASSEGALLGLEEAFALAEKMAAPSW